MKVFTETIRSNFKKSKVKKSYFVSDRKYPQRKLFKYNKFDE